jgi:hypothetical protein
MIVNHNETDGLHDKNIDIRVSAPGLKSLNTFTPTIPAVELAIDLINRYRKRTLSYLPASFVLSLAYRLLRRSERIEAGQTHAQLPSAPYFGEIAQLANGRLASPDVRPPFLAPVQKEVRRPARLLSYDDSRMAASQTRSEGSGNGFRRPMSPVQSQVAVDVNRLTDQVIQNIDRRIIAQRERLGKV